MIARYEFCPKVYAFLCRHHRPGRIGFVGSTDSVGMAIREAQKRITLHGEASRWSHVFLMGEVRLDGEPYIFESDLEPDFERVQVRNGAQESRLRKWAATAVEFAAVMEVPQVAGKVNDLLAAALRFVYEEHLSYPVAQLVGTWLHIVAARVWKPNPFEDAKALYCSSFVRHLFLQVGIDLVPGDIHLSNTAPEHLWQTRIPVRRFMWRRRASRSSPGDGT